MMIHRHRSHLGDTCGDNTGTTHRPARLLLPTAQLPTARMSFAGALGTVNEAVPATLPEISPVRLGAPRILLRHSCWFSSLLIASVIYSEGKNCGLSASSPSGCKRKTTRYRGTFLIKPPLQKARAAGTDGRFARLVIVPDYRRTPERCAVTVADTKTRRGKKIATQRRSIFGGMTTMPERAGEIFR